MKRVVLIALFVLVVASMMFAQAKPGGIARQVAMGGSQAGYSLVLNPFIMDDPALLLLNPAYQAKYRDYMWSNIAGGAIMDAEADNGYYHQNAGVAFGLCDAITVGMIFGYDPTGANDGIEEFNSGFEIPEQYQIPYIENTWEAVAAYRAKSMTLGLGIMYGWSNNEWKNDSEEFEASAYILGFRAGMIWDVNEDFSLDATATLNMNDGSLILDPDDGVTTELSAPMTEMQFYARGKFKMSNKFNLVPYASFGHYSAEPKQEEPTADWENTITGTVYAFGIGGEYRNEDFYFAGGISYQFAGTEDEYKEDDYEQTEEDWYTAFPVINFGGEWWLTDWMAGRLGYFRAIGSNHYKNDYPSSTSEGSYSNPHSNIMIGALGPWNYDGMVTLGVGFKFGGFALDATVSEEALRRGLGLIGADDEINTFGYMTASYNFAE